MVLFLEAAKLEAEVWITSPQEEAVVSTIEEETLKVGTVSELVLTPTAPMTSMALRRNFLPSVSEEEVLFQVPEPSPFQKYTLQYRHPN